MAKPHENITQKPSTPQQQSLGAVIAIVVIMAMIIIGAFYALNKRTHTQPVGTFSSTSSTTTP